MISARTATGSVSKSSEAHHLVHTRERREGRDKERGFDSPAGVDYIPIGGKVGLAGH